MHFGAGGNDARTSSTVQSEKMMKKKNIFAAIQKGFLQGKKSSYDNSDKLFWRPSRNSLFCGLITAALRTR